MDALDAPRVNYKRYEYGQTMSRHEFNPVSKREAMILKDAAKFEECVFKGVKDLRRSYAAR